MLKTILGILVLSNVVTLYLLINANKDSVSQSAIDSAEKRSLEVRQTQERAIRQDVEYLSQPLKLASKVDQEKNEKNVY